MAKIEFDGIEDYAKQLQALGANVEGCIKYAVYDAAGMVIEAIKANTPVDSGDLRKSAKLTTFKNKDGFIYTQVEFLGYDERGMPNPVKARVLESGSSTRKKHPFIRPAVNKTKAAAEKMIENNLNKKIEEIMERQ